MNDDKNIPYNTGSEISDESEDLSNVGLEDELDYNEVEIIEAHGIQKVARTSGGMLVASAMFAMGELIEGRKPREDGDIIHEASQSEPENMSIHFDPDDPQASSITIHEGK